ncbi:MAG: pilus assembly protein PilM [Lachnospiraceae bacterium]
MAKSSNRLLSIAINNEYIKIAEISKQGRNHVVHKAVTVATPERSYSDGVIRDRAILAKTIKIALDNHQITTTNVIFTIASTKVPTKEVIVPAVKNNKVGEIIGTNLAEYFPVNIEDYIWQHVVLEKIESGEDTGKLKVLVIMMPAEMIDAYYELASTLGLSVYRIDYVGNSIYQALKGQIDNEPSVVIQIENDSTIVNIFENNVLQLQRTIPYGKSVVVNMVMDKFGVRYDTALKKLQDEELVHSEFDGDDITDSLKYLLSNVNRVIDYYVSRNNSKPITKAYVIGNATTILGLVQLFANELNMPLMNIDALRDVTGDKKTYIDESSLPSYITNIGSVIAPVNFVPKNVKASASRRDTTQFFKVLLGAAVVASAAMVIVPLILMMSAKSERDRMQENVDKIKNIENIVAQYYDAKDIATDTENFRKLTVGNNDVIVDFINNLEKNIPSDVTFKSMSVNNGSVAVSGVCSGKPSVALLKQKLESIPNVASVVLGSVTETKDANGIVTASFTFTCTFSRVENVETESESK